MLRIMECRQWCMTENNIQLGHIDFRVILKFHQNDNTI